MRRHGRPLALIAILAAPSPLAMPLRARAAGATADRQLQSVARDHHRRGESLYVAERYPEALAEFEAGYAALPLPGFLINIGQCHRRMGDLERARVAFDRFLDVAPDSPLAGQVRNLIHELVLTPPPIQVRSVVAAPVAPVWATAAVMPRATAPAPSPAAPRLDLNPTPPLVREAITVTRVAEIRPLRTASSRRRPNALVWLCGGAAVAALVVAALVVGASAGTATTTVHDGSLGTLRR
jgi:tetratricopeptide (TPR) repeat protein